MRSFCYLLFLLFSTHVTRSQTRRVCRIQAVAVAPTIDGDLSDDVWKQCSVINDFTQTVPHPDQASAYNTDVRMCYTNSSVFIAATLYQPRSISSRQLTARDMLINPNCDMFSIYLDTYDDHQNAFVFRISSAGVQQDERLSGGSEYGDGSWDAVWTSKVSISEDCWRAEIEIPFSALRFSKQDEMKWGINFNRSVRKVNESSYWNKINVQKQGFLAQTGMLSGLKQINPPIRLFLFPYVSTGFLQQEESNVTTKRWLRSGGLDVKYGINESFTLDVTLIPDFSQVISDNLIRNLSPFEQQLNENRPFFTEGTDLFNKAGLFYSRRVGGKPRDYNKVQADYGDHDQYIIEKNPNVTTLYNGFKISGRTNNKLGIGLFNAIGAPMNARIKDKATGQEFKIETEPLTNYNVLVLDKALQGQSSFNFTNTCVLRNDSAQYANVSSFMLTKFNKKESYSLRLFSKVSMIKTSQSNIGTALGIVVAKTSGKFTFSASVDRQSPKFDKSDMGIQFDYNNSNASLSLNYSENKPASKYLQFYRINLSQTTSENMVPFVFKSYQLNASYFILFKNFVDVTYSTETKPIAPIDFYQLRVFGKRLKQYAYWYHSIDGSSDSRRKLFWSFNGGYGFANEQHTGYTYLNQGFRYRFSPKLDISINGEMTRDNKNIGYAFYDNINKQPVIGQRDVREYAGEISMKLNLSPNTNFTARFRHYNSFITYRAFYTVDDKGEWRHQPVAFEKGHDENYNLQNVDVFFNWIFRPGSRVVVSYKQWLNDAYLLNEKTGNSYFNNAYQFIKMPHAFELSARVIFFLDYNQAGKQRRS